MSEFNVHISLKGAAFDDLPEYEVARILREIAEHVENDGLLDYPRRIHDVNGNRVGFYQAEGN